MTNQDLDDLDQRIARMQDGMTVNREKLCRDVLALTQEVRNWRAAHARTKPKTEKSGNIFDDVFKDFM